MALVRFDEVVQHPLDDRLTGFFLDHPRGGMRCEAAAVDVWGWVIGRAAAAVAVEIRHDGRVVRRAPVNLPRPDVAAVYPDAAGGGTSGYYTSVNMLGRAATELEVHVVLRDQTRVPLATIRARGSWPENDTDLPLVSVVIPCYNQAAYLGSALESVVAQTYPHLEVLVIDDGSTDNTCEVARRFPGVRVVRQENQGRSAARNAGIRQSNGEYLVFLDGDDRLLPGGVAAGLEAFRHHPEVAFVTGRTRVIAADGTYTGDRQRDPVEGDTFAAMLRRCFVFGTGSALYRRSVFDLVGGFRTAMEPCEDYDLYLRIARTLPVHVHDAFVAEYRWHGTNSSAQAVRMLETSRRVLRAQRPYVRSSRRHLLAYRDGLRDLRQWCGVTVVNETRTALRERKWREATRGLWALSKCHPRGLASALWGGAS